jgi:hypothetical protein
VHLVVQVARAGVARIAGDVRRNLGAVSSKTERFFISIFILISFLLLNSYQRCHGVQGSEEEMLTLGLAPASRLRRLPAV